MVYVIAVDYGGMFGNLNNPPPVRMGKNYYRSETVAGLQQIINRVQPVLRGADWTLEIDGDNILKGDPTFPDAQNTQLHLANLVPFEYNKFKPMKPIIKR
jgi:hypothetical protein